MDPTATTDQAFDLLQQAPLLGIFVLAVGLMLWLAGKWVNKNQEAHRAERTETQEAHRAERKETREEFTASLDRVSASTETAIKTLADSQGTAIRNLADSQEAAMRGLGSQMKDSFDLLVRTVSNNK